MDNYAATNSAWPTAYLPAITRDEARRAAGKLFRHFAKRGWLEGRLRRCWISTHAVSTGTARGWWRLVHDVSHRVHRRQMPNFKDHGLSHAQLEKLMIEYVVSHRWLEGKLKPKERVKVTLTHADKIEHARRMLEKWERKAKLAATKVKLWKRRQTTAEKRAYASTAMALSLN